MCVCVFARVLLNLDTESYCGRYFKISFVFVQNLHFTKRNSLLCLGFSYVNQHYLKILSFTLIKLIIIISSQYVICSILVFLVFGVIKIFSYSLIVKQTVY